MTRDTLHADPFTHGHPIQQEFGRWYFHRAGENQAAGYKNGSYKGLDLTIGGRTGNQAYGGILIRALLPFRQDGSEVKNSLIEGPSLVVDHILAVCKCASIPDLVMCGFGDVKTTTPVAFKLSKLYLAALSSVQERVPVASTPGSDILPNCLIFAVPRVGLTLKKGSTVDRNQYLMKAYRFVNHPKLNKKGKVNILVGLYLHQLSQEQKELDSETRETASRSLSEATGSSLAQVSKCLTAFQKGTTHKNPQQLLTSHANMNNAETFCVVAGACHVLKFV
jgi:hypothetical protein